MGITGLLPFVKNSCRPANIKDFSGATVAIDAYSWLHKGAFSCAEKLVKGEKTDGYVFYCIKLLNMLLDAGVKPIMVFDGCNLASKAITEKKRRENRDKTKQRGKELLCEGKIKEARECFQRCVDVTPEMAREVILACKKKSIDCIVAPYEADAQMAYLDKIGVTQLTITEDSDLILFGCSKILFKMDSCGGGMLFENESLNKSFGSNASKYSFEKFRYMCILSGCDYLPSLPGIGLGKAFKFFSLTTNTDLNVILSKLPSYLKMPKLSVSEDYKDSFTKANNTFLYQLVFCPRKKCLVPLNPYPEGVNPDDMEYAGKYLDDDLAYQLAMGDINVKTLKKYDSNDVQNWPDSQPSKSELWSPLSSSAITKTSKKTEAFKFSTPKRKSGDIQKCISNERVGTNQSDLLSTEELFAMYGGNTKKSKSYDPYEEDPIFVSSEKKQSFVEKSCTNSPSPSVKKVVKSRFFSCESASSNKESSGYFSTPSSTNNSINEDFLCNSLASESSIPALSSPAQLQDESETDSNVLDESTRTNKENLINRFAKKKATKVSLDSESESEVKVSLSEVKDKDALKTPKDKTVSVLDVLSSESTEATSTISSPQKSSEKLSKTTEEEVSVVKIKPRNLFCKKNKQNPTKTTEGCEKSIDDSTKADSVEKSPLKEISPYFFNISDNQKLSDVSQDDSVIIVLSDTDDPDPSVGKTSTSPKSTVKKNTKHSSLDNKLTKCRSIGLSKKRKSTGTPARKESLLNFNFTRQSVSGK